MLSRFKLFKCAGPILFQQAGQGPVRQQFAVCLTLRTVIGFIGSITNPLDRSSAHGAWFSIASVNSFNGRLCRPQKKRTGEAYFLKWLPADKRLQSLDVNGYVGIFRQVESAIMGNILRIMKKRIVLKLLAYTACIIIASTGAFDIIGENSLLVTAIAKNSGTKCQPTPEDYLGPFYKADAPIRSSVGQGYELMGRIMSSATCASIPHARIELWLANPNGSYDDEHRATIFADETGEYEFESNFPPGYYGRPPHIHMRISAEGFETLVTQHYPTKGQTIGNLDIVLIPIE